jgi:phage gpG-like protein
MISVKIPNLPKFQKALKKYPQLAEKEIRNAFEKSLYQIVRETKPVTPVGETGRLRGSIGESIDGIFKIEKTRAMVGTNVNYAVYVHEGTRGRIGKPFLKQGVEKSISKIGVFFKEAIDNVFNKISKQSK